MHQKKKAVTAAVVILFFLAAGIWYLSAKDGRNRTEEAEHHLQYTVESVLTLTPTVTQPPKEKEPDIYVFVCGAVKTPGVYALPAGSRLYEAVYAAGGFLPEAETMYHNQARKVTDGERIYILSSAEASALTVQERVEGDTAENGTKASSAPKKINLNTAGAEQLTELPGIGSARAESIVEYRENVGEFQSVEEIMNISGIGQAMFDKIKDRITVE